MTDADYDIRLDEETHTYTVNGFAMPSVSAIIRDLNEFDGIPPAVLEEAAKRGTYVHKAVEYMLQGRLDWKTLHPKLQPYVRAADAFMVETGASPAATELPVYNPRLRYCGTIDAVVHITTRHATERWLIDWKTTAQLMPSAEVQTAAYQAAYRQTIHKSVKRAAVQLLPDGRYKFDTHRSREDFENFKAALRLYNWKHRK